MIRTRSHLPILLTAAVLILSPLSLSAAPSPAASVEGQPLAANALRLAEALEYLGAPLPPAALRNLQAAARARDAERIQALLDARALLTVTLNPEVRVKVTRGAAPAVLQQGGFTPVLVKVLNGSTATQTLHIVSPQSGPVYAGVTPLSMQRQRQEKLRVNENVERRSDRFLDVELFTDPPMSPRLSGLAVEYVVALIYSHEAGKREATIGFHVGEGTQELGFRGEVPVLFDVRPAVPVRLAVQDQDGRPTVGRFLFLDRAGHVYPPQAKRLAPDFFFQKQIYRGDGETVLLPPGPFTMFYGRGPEYRWKQRSITIPEKRSQAPIAIRVRLERWVNPMASGFYSGDHHIHAAGCAHYTSPSEGVLAPHMFRQVKGEGLNVGCVLTWGPCFDFQQQFFSAAPNPLSEPLTVFKYDIEVSGFGSQALGHVCLLNLKEQIYPGAAGSRNWPTWTTPVLRWAKSQGAVVGYAHSGSGLQVNAVNAARRLMSELDTNQDGRLVRAEAERGLLTEAFAVADADGDGGVSESELVKSHDRAADRLPNVAIPELNSVGAQEIFVTVPQGLCDFISAMDTARLLEWNCWYHLLNCGFPLKASGETDFPCMSSTRVGQGRVYVQLGKVSRLDYGDWCQGIRQGRSYVSDGYAHALEFSVGGKTMGEEVRLTQPASVKVKARVAFSAETPVEAAYGNITPHGGQRLVGDTVLIHDGVTKSAGELSRKKVELVVNGQVAASREVPADGAVHELEFDVPVAASSWVALRQFPQLHTNPVNVLVGGRPIRASRTSARWCLGAVDQLWRSRGNNIAPQEREAAQQAFEWAREQYRKIAAEAPEGS